MKVQSRTEKKSHCSPVEGGSKAASRQRRVHCQAVVKGRSLVGLGIGDAAQHRWEEVGVVVNRERVGELGPGV
jgi:hypothetical protein